ESIRNRWMRMTRDPAYAAMAAALLALWPFVLRDAVEAGVLRDEPDLRDFDLAAAANHFRATLRAHPLDALQTRYAADLDAQLPPGVHAVTDSGDIAPMEFRKDAPTAPPVSLRPPRTFRYRLPDTMYGNEYRYSIAHVPRERRRGMAYADAEFAEDSVVAQVPARVRKRAAYAGMLTVRAPGAGNPIALRIDGLEDAPEDPLVPVPPRADAMAAELPLRRTVDLERLERLLVDESEDVEDTATDDENPEARYAHVASMQALAIDLALSPPERYDATLGHALLSARESAATRALDALARHGVLGLSSGASARDAVGLGMVASDRFLLAVRARPLPQGFLDHPVWRAATGVLPLDALQAGELAHVCRLVGQSRLWLRPLFAEDCTHGLDALAGFRKQQVGGLLHFDIAVVYAKPDETDQETKVDQVVDEEDIKLVCRVADVMGPLGVSSAELAAICHALSFTRGIARAASFATAPQAAAVLRRLVTGNRLHSVGSTDERFVTPAIFHQHWCVHLPSPTGSRTYPPYIGHSRSPKVLSYVRTLTLGVLAWVREWPGVTARVLVRRRYAPVVCRADVERALDSLVRLQVIVRWWDEDMQEFAYRIASGYHYRLKALDDARTRSQPVPPLENIKAPPPNAKAVPPPKRGRLPRKSTAAADNSERALVLRRLVDALHDGDFDNDLDPSQEEEEDSDTEYAPDAENDTEKHTDESLENKEKKLILRIKMANIRERRATDTNASGSQPMRVEDVDWPEFDAETINDILRRRQELRSQQGSKENMARLKKSSLAPPPLQLEKAKSRQFVRAGSEEGEEVEGMDVDDADVPASAGQDHKNDE
ncbi:hypothetical protein LPJ73_004124, partial [Coemansia sp. RSA 2703]